MKRVALIAILMLSASCILGQGYNSREGSHRGYYTPDSKPQSSAWSGSGISIGSRIFATNNHVVDGATHIFAYFPEKQKKYSARVLCVDATNDLAIVEIDDTDFSGFTSIEYSFKRGIESIGEDVFVLGYPLITSMGEEVKLTTGVISACSGYQGDRSQYQISAPVQPGNSGGPLFNGDGELIGIVSAKHTEADNVSYGVKMSYLLDLIARYNIKADTSSINKIKGRRLSEKCKNIIPCTVLVLADNETDYQTYASAQAKSNPYFQTEHSETYPFHINMPSIARRSTDALDLYGIELTSNETVLYLTYTNGNTKSVNINVGKNTYLVDKMTGARYTLVDVKNCSISPKSTTVHPNTSIDFELHFPQLPTDTKQIDLCSPNSITSLWIYGIQIQ